MSSRSRRPVAVIGAGSWGTGLAWLLSGKGYVTRLWCRRPPLAIAINAARRNPDYLPEALLPEALYATPDLAEAVADAELVVMAVPSVGVAAQAAAVAPHLAADAMIVSATKGFDHVTGKRMTVTISEAVGSGHPVLALSGPNLAQEIIAGLPAVAVVAHPKAPVRTAAQRIISSPRFRVYGNPDVPGVELCGALKNPLAICAGMVDGLGLGDNSKAALMTRGMHEITRLGVSLGADARTFAGLCGYGDLLATCHSPHSRNRGLGERLGRGEPLDAILASTSEVAEGVATTRAAMRLATQHDVQMPIMSQLHAVLFEGRTLEKAIERLMTRVFSDEY